MSPEVRGPTADAESTRLAWTCLAHLEQEGAMLQAVLDSLQHVRTALLGGDLKALTLALERQEQTARASAELRRRRTQLREELAALLGTTPAAVTIQMLVVCLPEDLGQRLTGCGARLRQMTADVEELNRGNMALIRYSADFLHQLLVEITGGEDRGPGYSPAGVRQDAPCGSLIEARG